MSQVLPANETFESPDWLTSTSGATTKSLYWYNFWPGFSPGTQIDASTYSTYPMRTGGVLGGKGTSALLRPEPNSLTSIPCLMTDTNGMDSVNRIRSVLCREEASFNHDDQDITVTFGLETVGGATQGFAMSGTGGSSPSRGGRFKYPSASTTTGSVFTSMSQRSRGTWSSGGGMNSRGSDSSPLNPWPAWEGNAVYFRAGGGEPTPVNGAIEDAATLYTKRLWHYTCVTHYSFVAYPMGGSATAPNLYLELWQVKYTNAGGTSGNVPRRLIQQIVTGGSTKIDFRQGYHLRVKIENDGSSNPDINCFIGPYTDLNGDVQAEVQCFKTDAIADGNAFTVGSSVTHTAASGNVKDSHSDKISTFADRTIGFATAQEGLLDVSSKLGATDPVFYLAHSGVYSIESKSIPGSGSGTVRFRDEFKRVVEGATRTGTQSIVNPLVSQTSVEGVQANGLFTFDGYAQEFPTTLDTSTSNLDMIRRQLLWTSGTSSTTPTDFCLIDYDWDDSATARPWLVTRSFIHLRPSTNFYNHHRKIEFKPGAEAGLAGISTISYEMGIHLRGSFNGFTTRGLCAYIKWTTNGNGTITYGSVSIVYRNHIYSDQNPENTENFDYQRLIARRIYASGTSSGFPNLYDGNFHSLAFEVQNYAGSPSPEGIGEYRIKLNGSALELTDSTAPYQSSTVSPYTVIEPDPQSTFGNSEGFWFLGSISEVQAAGRAWSPTAVRNWTEESMTADPGGVTSADDLASISVTGEGTPSGSLNTSSGALAISGAGVWDVETTVTVENFMSGRYIPFDSGHKYTSPMYSKNRRRWQVQVKSMDLAIYQSLLSFYNTHDGMEIPFTFTVPIEDDGTETGSTAESTESVYAWFGEDSLKVQELPGQVYNASFSVEELLVS
jgi:hypothetical protein